MSSKPVAERLEELMRELVDARELTEQLRAENAELREEMGELADALERQRLEMQRWGCGSSPSVN